MERLPTTTVCPADGTLLKESATAKDNPLSTLNEKYEFIGETGRGGMAVIYKAKNRATGRLVAIKKMLAAALTDTAFMRFQQEAKAITSLRHPNIIMVHEFGVAEDGEPYMVMDFIEGSNLSELIKEKGSLSTDECMHRFIQLCDALQHAHSAGVLHRDLKPGNVMISSADGSFADARLVDFGIAKLMAKDGEEAEKLTMTGQLFGSPPYMSPEQCRGFKLDARTDIYSMGCVMYESLTGKVPLRGESILETIMMQVNDVPPKMKEACPEKEFSQDLENIIAKALAKEPNDRFQTMRELMVALMEAGSDIRSAQEEIAQTIAAKVPEKRFHVPISIYITMSCFFAAVCVFAGFWYEHTWTKTTNVMKSSHDDRTSLLEWMPREELSDDKLAALAQSDVLVTHLNLDDAVKLTDYGLKNLSRLTLLSSITLKDTNIGDRGLAILAKLPTLEKLDVTHTEVTDKGVEALLKAEKLNALTVNMTRVTDKGLETMSRMPHLRTAAIGYLPAVTTEGIKKLKDLNLRLLDLSGLPVTEDCLASFANMQSLKMLYLQDSTLSNATIGQIGRLNLQRLNISGTAVTSDGFKYLADLRNLKHLQAGALNLDDRGVSYLVNLPALNELNLDAAHITDVGAKDIAKIHSLRRLCLAGTQIGDKGVAELAKLPALESLDLQGTNVTDAGLNFLEKYPSLEYVCLSRCHNLSRTGVERLDQAINHTDENDKALAMADEHAATEKRPEVKRRVEIIFKSESKGW